MERESVGRVRGTERGRTYRKTEEDIEENDEKHGETIDQVSEFAQMEGANGHVFASGNHIGQDGDCV